MAASALLLRTLRVASSERVLYTTGSALYPTAFLHCRSETLCLRGSHLACRSFTAQALQASEPDEARSAKKKKAPASSWEEAGALFFSAKKGKNAEETGSSVAQKGDGRWEKKVLAVKESVQTRSSRAYGEEEESTASSAPSKFERKKERSTNSFKDSKFGNAKNGQTDFGRGREGSNARGRMDDGGYAQKQFSDVDNGREMYRGKGLREEFSGNGTYRRNARGDDDGDGAYRSYGRTGGFNSDAGDSKGAYRSNSRSGGFRREFSDGGDGKGTYRSNARSGGFREEFSEGVDGRGLNTSRFGDGSYRKHSFDSGERSKGMFGNKTQSGSFGKKQFPDLDGGKRMFRGKFQGDGFVRKQIRDIDDGKGNDDKSRRKLFESSSKKGLSRSKFSSGNRAEKLSQDEEVTYVTSENDDSESEDVPEAGDVIRYSEKGSGVTDDDYGELEEEEEEDDVDEDEDENVYRRRGLGAVGTEHPAMGSSLPRIKGEVVYGVGPVYAALQVSRREFHCLYVQGNMPIGGGNANKKKDKKALEWIIRSAIDRGLEVKEISKHDLNMLADNRPHQGLILDASQLELVVSSELDAPFEENGKAPVWVALDEVTDPQNFGAILRSAYFLGAAGVVVCAKNSAPLSAVVSKASAGALEVMELRSCKNMMKFLDKSTENGWRVVGGSAAGADVTPVRELPRGVPTILVLGGEGKGLRTNVKRSCSEMVCIPGLALESQAKRGSLVNSLKKAEDAVDVDAESDKLRNYLKGAGEDFIAVESLNVSVAAGILLHELLNSQAPTECLAPVQAVVSDEQDNPVEAMTSDKQDNRFQQAEIAETE